MRDHKTAVTINVVLGVILFGGGGLFIWKFYSDVPQSLETVKNAAVISELPSPSKQSNNTVSVSPAPAANNLGQLSPKQILQDNSSTNSSLSQIDPATLKQYEAYKQQKTALYADVNTGDGAELVAGKRAVVRYIGWLDDGTEFDHTPVDAAGDPQDFTFTEGAHQVIAGWEQGLYGMKAGGVRLLVVPPSTGYGSTVHGPIPANSVLIFEVQLLSVE